MYYVSMGIPVIRSIDRGVPVIYPINVVWVF